MSEDLIEDKYFILYKPKDIVSGDFYWALSHKHRTSNEEMFYMCTADCTGHGVPGAFMSMLNISYLNESILERNLEMPHEVLTQIREEVIAALNPEGSDEESKDGMDCVLTAFNFDKMKLYFAAANNPLWHIRDGVLTEYKADKMPVGKYGGEERPFALQQIDLKSGDLVYTFTDGYADQFGGPNGKKFKYKQLENLLVKNAALPMKEQKHILDRTIEDWKSGVEQIDDILVIGVRI